MKQQIGTSLVLAAMVVGTAYWLATQHSPKPQAQAAVNTPGSVESPPSVETPQSDSFVVSKQMELFEEGELAGETDRAGAHRVPFSDEEWRAVRHAAAARNETITEFIRQRLLDACLDTIPSDRPMS